MKSVRWSEGSRQRGQHKHTHGPHGFLRIVRQTSLWRCVFRIGFWEFRRGAGNERNAEQASLRGGGGLRFGRFVVAAFARKLARFLWGGELIGCWVCVSGVRMEGGAPRCCASFRLGRPAADGIAEAIESERARDRKGPQANFARMGEEQGGGREGSFGRT